MLPISWSDLSVDPSISNGDFAIAVSPDGGVLYLGHSRTGTVYTFELPSARKLHQFGKKGENAGEFSDIFRMAVHPTNGNIVVPEIRNHRIQEVTPSGTHVRFIGSGVGDFRNIAVSVAHVAGIVDQSGTSLAVFEYTTGELLHRFGKWGHGNVEFLFGCYGVRFTPDCQHIILAESSNARVTEFTLAGEFVRHLVEKTRSPRDVDFAPNGDVLVSLASSPSIILVLARDDVTCTRSIQPPSPDSFATTDAIAVSGGRMYVVNSSPAGGGGPRIHVFE